MGFDFRKTIKEMAPPVANEYFELVSADGFAFSAVAKWLLGLDASEMYCKMLENELTLKAARQLNGVSITENCKYIYTLWPCTEYAWLTNDQALLKEIRSIFNQIGFYRSGWARYCTEEIYFTVPNATSAMALVAAYLGENQIAVLALNQLKSTIKDGNWSYYDMDDPLEISGVKRVEDCYHLAMIVYQVRETVKILKMAGIEYRADFLEGTRRLLLSAKPRCSLCHIGGRFLCYGSKGWGYPMQWLALREDYKQALLGEYKGQKRNLFFEGYENALFEESLNNPNFRVRAITAWAIAKIYTEVQKK